MVRKRISRVTLLFRHNRYISRITNDGITIVGESFFLTAFADGAQFALCLVPRIVIALLFRGGFDRHVVGALVQSHVSVVYPHAYA